MRHSGNNGYNDFGQDDFDAKTKLSKSTNELKIGPAAKMGIISLMVHKEITPPCPWM